MQTLNSRASTLLYLPSLPLLCEQETLLSGDRNTLSTHIQPYLHPRLLRFVKHSMSSLLSAGFNCLLKVGEVTTIIKLQASADLSNRRITVPTSSLGQNQGSRQSAGWQVGVVGMYEFWQRDGQDLNTNDTDFQGSILAQRSLCSPHLPASTCRE